MLISECNSTGIGRRGNSLNELLIPFLLLDTIDYLSIVIIFLPLHLGFELTGDFTFFAFSLSTLPILNYLYLDIFSSR